MIRASFTLAVVLAFASTAVAQQQPATGTTVQLPTISSFSINTVVSAPDAGTGTVGRIRRSSEFNLRRPGFRSSSRSNGGSGVAVSPKLIIGSEVDAELVRRGKISFARTARPDIHGTQAEKIKALFIAQNLGRGWK